MLVMAVTPANSLSLGLTLSGSSFIYARNNMGPRTPSPAGHRRILKYCLNLTRLK